MRAICLPRQEKRGHMKDQDPIQETAGYLVYRVGRLLRFRAAQFFRSKGLDISPEQWSVLMTIAHKSRPALSDLADATMGDHPNVTRLVDGLTAMGLARRIPNPGDKRSSLVEITDKGESFIDDIWPDLLEAKAEYFDGMDQNEVTTFIRLLRLMQTNLEAG